MSPEQPSTLSAGTILDQKFRVTREIGRGGMATIYEAENIGIGKRVAVKLLAPELVTSRIVTERFLREARAAAAVRSPYICDVYDVGTFDGRPFLVMELLEGESLYERLSRERQLSIPFLLKVIGQVCRGLTKAHESGVVHRDLKPENIFLARTEEGEIAAKLVDFGLAKFYEMENEGVGVRLTREGALFGTPAYMSPEQARAKGEVDHRADLWALACIVYECLTGRTVWNIDQGVAMILAQIASAPVPVPSTLRRELPPTFDDWFAVALHRNADRRFQSAREFWTTLVTALGTSEPDALTSAAELSKPTSTPHDRSLGAGAVTGDPGSTPAALESAEGEHAPIRSRASNVTRGVVFALLLLGLGVGGLAYYRYLAPTVPFAQPLPALQQPADSTAAAPSVHFAVSDHAQPLETEPFAMLLGKGQARLGARRPDEAYELFKDAFVSNKHNAARSFVAHLEAVRESADGQCSVTGLGRPRPFAVEAEPASNPSLALTREGLLVAWYESTAEKRGRQAFATVLDGALRRVLPTRALTPGATDVERATLVESASTLALAFQDQGQDHNQARVYLQELKPDGEPSGAPRPLDEDGQRQAYPTLAAAAGQHLAVWVTHHEEGSRPAVSDLMARRLDSALRPQGSAVQLTRYTRPAQGASTISEPTAAIAGHFLYVAYALQRSQEHPIMLLRVDLESRDFAEGGLKPRHQEKPPQSTADTRDLFLGSAAVVSSGAGEFDAPRLSCLEASCYLAWDNDQGAAFVARVDPTTSEVLWRKELGEGSTRPTIGVSPSGAVLVWYSARRVKLAALTPDGISEPTVLGRALGRVSGTLQTPSVISGGSAGRWYVGWRDYEAARHEAFVARADCAAP